MRVINSYHLGRVDYLAAWQLQKDLAQARGQNAITDSLLLLEHPHTYTLGSSGKREHLLLSEAELQAQGIAVYDVDRGGDITYHGLGQLVGYPIIKLDTEHNGLRVGVVDYIRQLEEMLIVALANYGVRGERLTDYTGVWVPWQDTLHKIAAIGVKVTGRAVTMHGFALNLNTDMRYFQGIIPCGIDDKPVISLAQLLGETVDIPTALTYIEQAMAEVFHADIVHQDATSLVAHHP